MKGLLSCTLVVDGRLARVRKKNILLHAKRGDAQTGEKAARHSKKGRICQRREDTATDISLPTPPIAVRPARMCSVFLALCPQQVFSAARPLNRRREACVWCPLLYRTVIFASSVSLENRAMCWRSEKQFQQTACAHADDDFE